MTPDALLAESPKERFNVLDEDQDCVDAKLIGREIQWVAMYLTKAILYYWILTQTQATKLSNGDPHY